MLVRARLTDVAITTYTADSSRLVPQLPAGIEPWLVLTGAGDRALVSAVSFQLHDLRVGRLRWRRFRCGHVDYRAYVRHQDSVAVWFLGAAMGSRLATGLRRVWAMPWHRARVDLSVIDGYRLSVTDALATVSLYAAASDGRVPGHLDGFASMADAHAVLVNPTVGLFAGRRSVRRYEVEHDPLAATAVEPRSARFELFERLGLVVPGQQPHSVLVLPDFPIHIRLPPRPV